jgi:hypothetical protein
VVRTDDQKLKTNWYRKPTNSGRILNYLSNHPNHQKINMVKNLVDRANNLSDEEFKSENMAKIKQILGDNNYPNWIFRKIVGEQNNRRTTIRKDNEESIRRCRFPNIPILSSKFKHLFEHENQIQLVLYSVRTTNSLFSSLKDIDPIWNRSELIYEIPCSNCSKIYIGQTKQKLMKRIQQHKYDCRYESTKSKTALSEHHFQYDPKHNFDFDNTKILDYESNFQKRNISEMTQIMLKKDQTVNHRTDTNNISHQYSNILLNYKNQQRQHQRR